MKAATAETRLEIDAKWDGFSASQRASTPEFLNRLAWAHKLINNTDRLPGPAAKARLFQAMGTADFPYLAGSSLERSLVATFNETPAVMDSIFQKTTHRDFRQTAAVRLDGADSRLQEIGESGEYTDANMAETAYLYALKTWGKKIPMAWRLLLNDDLAAFNSIPTRFGRGARRTREWYLTQMFWDADGPLDAYFDVTGKGQDGVASTALNPTNLAAAITEMLLYTDDAGNPITVVPKYLVVPPALYQTAIECVSEQNLAVIATGVGNSAASQRLSSSNEFIRRFKLEVLNNPWIPQVVTSGTKGATTWALFTDPNELAAGEMATLEGEAGPQVFLKVSNQQRVGGGVDPMGGSFENDSVEYKVRDVFNAVRMAPQAGWASDGQ